MSLLLCVVLCVVVVCVCRCCLLFAGVVCALLFGAALVVLRLFRVVVFGMFAIAVACVFLLLLCMFLFWWGVVVF